MKYLSLETVWGFRSVDYLVTQFRSGMDSSVAVVPLGGVWDIFGWFVFEGFRS